MVRSLIRRIVRCLHPETDALSLSEARYAGLFNHVPDGVYESLPDGTIRAANPALVRMLGYGSEQELRESRRAEDFYVRPEMRAGLLRRLEAEGAIRNVEIDLYRKDGSIITILENARAVRAPDGRLLCYQGTMTDITERKAAEEERRRAHDQALEASRLKTRFLANVSHELRTPLNGVLAMAQVLAESPLAREQQECVATIEHSAHYLLGLINDILDLSCIEAGQLELEPGIFRVRDVVEETAALAAPRADAKGVALVTDIDPALPELLLGDCGRIRQVLTNLAVNAVKFTVQGEVVLRAGAAPGGGVCFTVQDTGIGIEPSAREVIFEPFRQADGSTKRKFGGTGLGLAIARQIAVRMGGRLEVESEPGRGSTFSFTAPLPRAPGCRVTPARPLRALEGVPVLLAEPQECVRSVIAGWLTRWGAQVRILDAPLAPGGGPPPRLAVAAEELIGSGPSAVPAFLPPGVPAVLIGRVRAEAVRAPWAAGRISRPVRELSLLAALLRAAAGPAPPPAGGGLARLSEAVGPARPARRILAAEDNPVNQLVIERLVRRLGYDIDVVASGEEAAAAAARGGYDAILMDCQMPGMDGFEATAAIRALPGGAGALPIIAVTAHATAGDRRRCLDAGMDDYLAKPVLLDGLAQVLARWLSRPRPLGVAPRNP